MLIDRVGVNQRLADVVGQQALGEGGDNLLGMAARLHLAQRRGHLLLPGGKVRVHAGDEGGELGVLVDRGLDRGLVHGESQVAGAAMVEQSLTELRADRPIGLEHIHITRGDTAAQVALNILKILGLLAINVARDIEVELILRDLREGDHTRILGHLKLLGEDIDDLMDVLGAQPVLGAVLDEARAGVDHKDTRAGVGILLIHDDDTGGDAGAVEQVGGQADDALDIALADQGAANIALGVTAK